MSNTGFEEGVSTGVVGEDCLGGLHCVGGVFEGWGQLGSVGHGGGDDRVAAQAAVSRNIIILILRYVSSQMHGKCTHNMHRFLSQSWKSSVE